MKEKIYEGIFRIIVPFENIYTSVFLFVHNGTLVIFDSGNNGGDVNNYIIPAVNEIGIKPEYLICSHLHEDHSGGNDELLKIYPDLKVCLFDKNKSYGEEKTVYIKDGELLLERFMLLNLKGHTDDCLATFDTYTKMLFSGDCLQQRGITRFGTAVSDYNEYKKSILRVRRLNPKTVIASHSYVPCGYAASTEKILFESEKAIDDIKSFVKKHREYSSEIISELYNKENKYPTVSAATFEGIASQINQQAD